MSDDKIVKLLYHCIGAGLIMAGVFMTGRLTFAYKAPVSIRREIETSFRNYIVGATIVKLSVFPTGEAGPAGGNSLKVILSLKLDKSDLEIFDVGVKIA